MSVQGLRSPLQNNIEKSKQFYHDLFGLDLVLDNDGNVILTEGLVLQDEKKAGKNISFSSICQLTYDA